jgi:hypothetical protein
VAGKNNALIAFDNLSHLPQWLSDFMCCLSTGAGFATRSLYADDEESIFAMKRPIIFNAINEVATRPDLLDRCILLELPVLPKSKRKEERAQEEIFQREAPSILGLLFDAVATGLKNLPNIKLENLPRMADFATWAAACAPALDWTADEFLAAYDDNRDNAQNVATDLSTLATVIEDWAQDKDGVFFNDAPQELFETLGRRASIEIKDARNWPKDAAAMGKELKRLAPALRAHGIDATDRRSNGKKKWKLSKNSVGSDENSASADTVADTADTVFDAADTVADTAFSATVELKDSEKGQNSVGSVGKTRLFSSISKQDEKEEKRKEKEEKRKEAESADTADTADTVFDTWLPEMPTAQPTQKPNARADSEAYSRPTNEPTPQDSDGVAQDGELTECDY